MSTYAYAEIAFLCASLLLLFGALAIRLSGRKRTQFTYNAVMLLVLIVLSAYLIIAGPAPDTSVSIVSISFNAFSALLFFLFSFGMLMVNLLAYEYSSNYADFALMSDFALLGMIIVASSASLVSLFIGLELTSIPTTFAILLERKSIEPAVKFFIMASISIAIFAFAAGIYYVLTNSLALSPALQEGALAFAAFIFIASLSFDASIFPFNILIPDVYEGSRPYITAMLGGINKKVGFAALIQIMILLFFAYNGLFIAVAILSVVTMFYGNLPALSQSGIKRLFAYSSISQAGYILIGIAADSAQGITASLFQIFAHSFAFIGIFAIFALMESRGRTKISDMAGLSSENRLAAFALAIFMFSFIGVPFTMGFIGKFLLFLSAVNSGLYWLAIIGIINSVISIYYYFRLLIASYSKGRSTKHFNMPQRVTAVVVICLAATILFGIYPIPIISISSSAASYLFSHVAGLL
jgi:NADH-quinone oxidoreductase subunit N